MRKEAAVLGILTILLIFFILGVSATSCTTNSDCASTQICNSSNQCVQNTSLNVITSASTNQDKINKAYDCLNSKIKDKCSSISSEEKVFSLMAVGKCQAEVQSDSKYKTNIKYTAQAIMGLNHVKVGSSDAESWLLSQNTTPTDLVWYLQIESPQATTCTISYSGASYTVSIGADKKISSPAGSCLSLSDGSYWLIVAPSCYQTELQVSCDQGFQTNLLFRKANSATIHVSEKTSSAASQGTTTETVNSVCFGQGSCDYEGSLWAAIALNYEGYDISAFIPYLITMAEDNPQYLPESFLYNLINSADFRSALLLKQINNQYWSVSNDQFYDTALALLPLQAENPTEKTNAINWLLTPGVQDTDGCWKQNIRNTAFLLYSIWPRSSTPITPTEDCESNNGYCMSATQCEGKRLADLDCAGNLICCDTPITLKTCQELGGTFCQSDERCSGTVTPSSDSGTCCVGGSCETVTQQTQCELQGGQCRTDSCNTDEEQNTAYSCNNQDICCVQKTTPIGGSKWWIWLLIILIILVVIGIIFRDKLRRFWFTTKSKFGGSSRVSPGPGFPPSSRAPMTGPPRRILPPPQPARPPMRRAGGEMDEVLKKLKEMSK